jgi:hypothetical protein
MIRNALDGAQLALIPEAHPDSDNVAEMIFLIFGN